MQTGYISFCDTTAFNIKTENTIINKHKIIKQLLIDQNII